MSRVPRWGYGSKRRIRLIRWSPYQIAGLIVLAFSLVLLGFFVARWLAEFEMHEREKHDSEAVSVELLYEHGLFPPAAGALHAAWSCLYNCETISVGGTSTGNSQPPGVSGGAEADRRPCASSSRV